MLAFLDRPLAREQHERGAFACYASNDVDTITGASLSAHELHSATWDMTDYRGQPVADGAYTIVIESTDNLDESYVTELAFIKGREPTHVEIEETTSFGPIVLTYTPAP